MLLAAFPDQLIGHCTVSKEQFKHSLEEKVKQGPSNPQRKRGMFSVLTHQLKWAALEVQTPDIDAVEEALG